LRAVKIKDQEFRTGGLVRSGKNLYIELTEGKDRLESIFRSAVSPDYSGFIDCCYAFYAGLVQSDKNIPAVQLPVLSWKNSRFIAYEITVENPEYWYKNIFRLELSV
jgi:hypothetical protein